jgi:hypothetical protein
MYCIKCGASISANSNICEACRTPLFLQDAEIKGTEQIDFMAKNVDDFELDEDVKEFIEHVDQAIIRLSNIIVEKE